MPNQSTADTGEHSKPMKVAEVADRYGVSTSTVYREIKAGRLTAFRIGTGRGTVRVPEAALADFDSAAIRAAQSEVAA